jgi:hypothetical protein
MLAPLAAMVVAELRRHLSGMQSAASGVGDRPHELLRTQEQAAKASGLALTEFKRRLALGEVPANYEDGKRRSYDPDVLRRWAAVGYVPFDRDDPVNWTIWLYREFGMTPAGRPLAE